MGIFHVLGIWLDWCCNLRVFCMFWSSWGCRWLWLIWYWKRCCGCRCPQSGTLNVDNTVDPIVSNILLDNALTSRRVLSSPETLSPLSLIGCIFFIGFYTVVGNDICGCCCEKSREDDDMEEPYFMGRPNKDDNEVCLLFRLLLIIAVDFVDVVRYFIRLWNRIIIIIIIAIIY